MEVGGGSIYTVTPCLYEHSVRLKPRQKALLVASSITVRHFVSLHFLFKSNTIKGAKKPKHEKDLRKFDVVLTTFQV